MHWNRSYLRNDYFARKETTSQIIAAIAPDSPVGLLDLVRKCDGISLGGNGFHVRRALPRQKVVRKREALRICGNSVRARRLLLLPLLPKFSKKPAACTGP